MRGAAVLLAAAAAAFAVWLLVPRAPVHRSGRPERVEVLDTIPLEPRDRDETAPLPSGPGAVIVRTNAPDATVRLHFARVGADPAPAPLETVANANGDAGFEIAPERRAWGGLEAEVDAPGHTPLRALVPVDGEAWLRLERGLAVRGRVVDGRGEPVARARVTLHSGSAAWSDAEGRFACGIPRPGRYGISVWHERYVDTRVERELRAGAEVTIVLEAGLSLSGRVAFPDGSPVPGAEVRTQSARAVSDAQGGYTLTGLTPGPVTLRCEVAGANRQASAGETGVDFRVEHHVVRVRCVDEAGRPFFGAGARVVPSPSAGPTLASAECFPCPLGSRIVITASAPGHRTFRAEHDLSGPPARLFEYMAVLTR